MSDFEEWFNTPESPMQDLWEKLSAYLRTQAHVGPFAIPDDEDTWLLLRMFYFLGVEGVTRQVGPMYPMKDHDDALMQYMTIYTEMHRIRAEKETMVELDKIMRKDDSHD
ncbi:hypothetical protein AWB80_02912 [Caballeronia pedi]|uniref:Uncharacterized protein n=1 Tax=Caballeronia pedi TaxID=1777141 RepID=A0A158B0J0_9BURK|nr:hypothetical protein [Caballeronia pedi]SAK63738.1 hypothetical protein AWB80_02912 [Caballeronia pedi]